ncbi:hypothetical protein CERSUDRAFT_160359 [Gelatoporia subvermispora B]|uniref:Cytochrome P450 n=1 Tax=Ceriporiopsis subvermispora (strain B) TaxID=914234 RepID=M2PCN0_CERS8|nr:hypothetical protein CERSUDRAFT_160359 [Gelatoporia subvermispora B]
MSVIFRLLWPLIYACSAYAVYRLVRFLVHPWFTRFRYIRGPPSASLYFGNLKQMFDADDDRVLEGWVEKYGNTYKYYGLFNMHQIFTMDLKVINYILRHSTEFPKPRASRFFLSKLLGEGVLVAEGEEHRKQRRIMNPAFGPAQIRELTGTFMDKAIELQNFWDSAIQETDGTARIDVCDGLTKATLNIIGSVGFNYEFDAFNPSKNNELFDAFNTIFSTTKRSSSVLAMLQAAIPILSRLPGTRLKKFEEARGMMHRIGMELVQEKKAAVLQSLAVEKNGGAVGRKDVHALTLIKANMATDLPDHLKLSDEDVVWRTFLVAGHETTSSGVTWCLYALTQAPKVQKKLREELFTLNTETPTMDELNSLQYLDAVVRETLRVHAPVAVTTRELTKDTVLPLGTPYTDTRGQAHHTVPLEKGTAVLIPILAINRAKSLWGEDSFEYKPERWKSPPETISEIPGAWSNMLTFIGGPRACIGYRFTLVEMKVLIFTLVRAFEFELAVPAGDVTKRPGVAQRPIVKSEIEKGNQMPLLVKRHVRV